MIELDIPQVNSSVWNYVPCGEEKVEINEKESAERQPRHVKVRWMAFGGMELGLRSVGSLTIDFRCTHTQAVSTVDSRLVFVSLHNCYTTRDLDVGTLLC